MLENERGLGSRRAAAPNCLEVLDASGLLDLLALLCGAGCWVVLDTEIGLGSSRAATPSCPGVLDASGLLDLLALLCGAGCWLIVCLPLLFFEGEVSAPP